MVAWGGLDYAKAMTHSYDEIWKRHNQDYKKYFDRVQIDSGQTAPDIAALPTDVQLLQYNDKGQANPDLRSFISSTDVI